MDSSEPAKAASLRKILFMLCLCTSWSICCRSLRSQEIAVPRLLDRQLQLSLLASEPEVVTPVGLAADRNGRLFVVESHTHSRPRSYEGPASDRILVFEDTDGDGQLDQPRVFADGLHQALAMAFSADNELYVVQMKSVVVLRDMDGDGKCELRQPVLTVETTSNNHHGVLLAVAFDHQNRMYVSLGNISGHAYSLLGSDDSLVEGQGDTGLVIRCGADGSSVERFAHGFWNPCDLKFDTAGRLLATDNDPDSRGPNRVLHIVQGGEYGFRSRFGGSGLHPFCAWNGELPGTLPMLAGVGEAPVGLLDCNATSLPNDYADDLLVAVWGTHEVVRVHTERRGASLTGRVQPLIVGDPSFRPTGMAATADGTVYIADWVDRRYPVHGKGRIWRLGTRPGTATLKPLPPFSSALQDAGQTQLEAIGKRNDSSSFDQLVGLATRSDPFIANAAVGVLTQSLFRESVLSLLEHDDAARRMAALLTLRKANVRLDQPSLRRLLADHDAQIRKMTLVWIGESMRLDLAGDVKESLPLQSASADLFETFLATVSLLTDEEIERIKTKKPGHQIQRLVDSGLLHSILADPDQNSVTKAMAVRYLGELDEPKIQLLSRLAESNDVQLASEVIRTLATSDHDRVEKVLSKLAFNAAADVSIRCDAIMAYVASPGRDPDILLPLLSDANDELVLTVVRGLTYQAMRPSVRQALTALFNDSKQDGLPPRIVEQIRFALRAKGDQPERSDEEWKQALASGDGDADAGRRVFYDPRTTCAKCHTIHGRGGWIGPGLSTIASAKTSAQILQSILHPSQEMSPDYQGYFVVMNDGRVHRGVQFHFRGEDAEMQLDTGELIRFALRDTEEYGVLKESLMPADLVHTMSVAELRDLLSFLGTLGSKR